MTVGNLSQADIRLSRNKINTIQKQIKTSKTEKLHRIKTTSSIKSPIGIFNKRFISRSEVKISVFIYRYNKNVRTDTIGPPCAASSQKKTVLAELRERTPPPVDALLLETPPSPSR